jgi:hypothetical protein
MDVRARQPSTSRKLLQSCCPTIRIRSPRSNVCDVCAILYSRRGLLQKVRGLFESHLDPLQSPVPNFEKKQQIFSKVRPYVPMEFRADPIYDAPNDDEEQLANEAKQARPKAPAKRKKVATAAAEAKDAAPVPEEGETVALAGEKESEAAAQRLANNARSVRGRICRQLENLSSILK